MKFETERNKKIAIFMGLAYCNKHLFEGWYRDHEFNYRICGNDGLKYKTSWKWLMPVVEKIESLGGLLQIEGNMCNVYFDPKHTKENHEYINDNKKSAIYSAVFRYIEWHETHILGSDGIYTKIES
jgi:hypothetical protein